MAKHKQRQKSLAVNGTQARPTPVEAKAEFLDFQLDLAVVIRCLCPAKRILLTRTLRPAKCPHCGLTHHVASVDVKTPRVGEFEIQARIDSRP